METMAQSNAATTQAAPAGAEASAPAVIAGPKPYQLTQRTLFNAAELRRLTADYEVIRRSLYVNENLIYFDYRLSSLVGFNEELLDKTQKVKIKNINPSQYYNKILEIQAGNV